MSDIFISYAKEDRPRAQMLAQALMDCGWLIFWDRKIPSGDRWRKIIEKELNQARCVIVLWSRSSINSGWVQDEADDANRRGILVPVLIEDVLPPIGFRGLQAADLMDWDPTAPTPAFRQLIADIKALIGSPKEAKSESPEPDRRAAAKVPWRSLGLVVLVIGVASLIGYLSTGQFQFFHPPDVIARHPPTPPPETPAGQSNGPPTAWPPNPPPSPPDPGSTDGRRPEMPGPGTPPIQASAKEGWIYAGSYLTDSWTNKYLNIASTIRPLSLKGQVVYSNTSLNLHRDHPSDSGDIPPSDGYIVEPSDKLVVKEVWVRRGGQKVWLKIVAE